MCSLENITWFGIYYLLIIGSPHELLSEAQYSLEIKSNK